MGTQGLDYTPILTIGQLLEIASRIKEAREQSPPYGGASGSWADDVELDIRTVEGRLRVAFVQEDWDEDSAWLMKPHLEEWKKIGEDGGTTFE